MRYGIVREASYLPAVEWQRNILNGLNCDVIQQLAGEDLVTDRRIGHVLFELKAQDEIVVCNLTALARTMIHTVRILSNVVQLGVVVIVASDRDNIQRITAKDSVVDVLGFLAMQEHQRQNETSRREQRRIQGVRQKVLTRYQIEYARKIYAQGMSIRQIGLLFQASPNDVWSAIAPQGGTERANRDDGF